MADWPTVGEDDDPRQTLIDFLRKMEEFLDAIIKRGEDESGAPLFPEDKLALIRAAWREAKPKFGRVIEAVPLLTRSTIDSHGLSGAEMAFKLEVVRLFSDWFKGLGGGEWFKKLLDAIDNVFDSLKDAAGDEAKLALARQENGDMKRFHFFIEVFGAAGAIKEIKHGLGLLADGFAVDKRSQRPADGG